MLLICKNVEREAEGAAVKKLIDEGYSYAKGVKTYVGVAVDLIQQ